MGLSYRAHVYSTPSLYLMCAYARDVQPLAILSDVVVVVAVVAISGVRLDERRWVLVASKSDLAEVESLKISHC